MTLLLDRHWLLSSTTYGTWLPGDKRGFVGPVDSADGGYEIHNTPGTECDRDNPDLAKWSAAQLKCPPIYLNQPQAERIIEQFLETTGYRGWKLLVASVMANHFHAFVTVPGDPDPEKLLGDLKSYASRVLNQTWGKPDSGTWWTERGSKRKKSDERAVVAAVRYVWNQQGWLARYVDPEIPKEWLTPKNKRRTS